MIETLVIVSVFALGIMVLVWFFLVSKLFALLRDRHISVYVAMGSPRLIANNSLGNNLAFLRFLLQRQDRNLNDGSLSRLCRFMVVFFGAYSALCILSVILGMFAAQVFS